MRAGAALLACAAALAAGLPSPATAAASRAELEERVVQLERAVDNRGLLEIARQLETLQAEVRALRGGLEELQFALDGAKQQQRDQCVMMYTTAVAIVSVD